MGGRSLDYLSWTQAIGRRFFRPEFADEPVYLAVDAQALLEAATMAEPPVAFDSAEAAAIDFVQAVRQQLRKPAGWELVGLSASDAPPGCLGLLAFQVYAAFCMMKDANWTPKAYWPRVRELLHPCPLNLDTDQTHQFLWRKVLQRWVNDSEYQGGRRGRLILPPENDGRGHRHIRLPLSQALLRTEDKQRLPAFFKEAGLVPGEVMTAQKLARSHGPLLDRRDLFTSHAIKVFTDHRREGALGQICQSLLEWDGSLGAQREKRSRQRPLRLWCNLHHRRGLSGGLAYRNENGLWQPVEGWSFGQALAPSLRPPQGYTYTPFYQDRRLLVFDTGSGRYLEARSASNGDRIIVLARESLFSHLVGGLEKLGLDDQADLPAAVSGVPSAWRLIKVNELSLGPNPPWPWSDMLDVEEVGIHLVGGLKLSRSAWLEGAGPRVELRGQRLPQEIWLDGREKLRVHDGQVISPRLGVAGAHSVWVPGAPQRKVNFHVAAPRIRHLAPKPWCRIDEGWPERSRRGELTEDTILGPIVRGEWPPRAEAPTTLQQPEQPFVEEPAPHDAMPESLPTSLLVKLMVAHRRKLPQLLSSKELSLLQQQEHPLVQVLLQGLQEEVPR